MTAKPQILRTQAEQDLVRQFDERFAGKPDRLAALRTGAFTALKRAGLPHRRVEEYRYTDLKSAFKSMPEIAPRPRIEAVRAALAVSDPWEGVDRHRIVFADGHFMAELSMTEAEGISVAGLAAALDAGEDVSSRIGIITAEGDAAVNLNTAFMGDGALVRIAPEFGGGKPIEFVFLAVSDTAAAQYARCSVTVEAGASVTVMETHLGADGVAHHSNVVFETDIAEKAELRWLKVQRCGDSAVHLGSMLAKMGADARFDHFVFNLGARLSRSQLFLTFGGEGAEAALRGVSMLRDRQHADITLLVDHAVPSCTSQERFKSVIDGHAKGVFQGKIVVRPEAQKTDGQMMTQTLLLSDEAQVANKPELEIFADDVQCAHGATTGQIDEDLLFYLMARGIPEEQARTLLVLAFVGETIEEIGDDDQAAMLERMSRIWLLGEDADS